MACQVGAAKLQQEILDLWGGDVYNAGCFNPNSFFDGTRTPSAHGKGEAIDIGISPSKRGRNSTGQQIFRTLYELRNVLGIVQLIWDSQIWSATNQPHLIRPYTVNRHVDHIHVQFSPAYARNSTLTIHRGVPPTQEIDMALTGTDKSDLVAARTLAQGAYEAALRAEANSLRAVTLLEKEVLPRSKKALMALTGRSGQVRQIQADVKAHNDLVALGLADIAAKIEEVNR